MPWPTKRRTPRGWAHRAVGGAWRRAGQPDGECDDDRAAMHRRRAAPVRGDTAVIVSLQPRAAFLADRRLWWSMFQNRSRRLIGFRGDPCRPLRPAHLVNRRGQTRGVDPEGVSMCAAGRDSRAVGALRGSSSASDAAGVRSTKGPAAGAWPRHGSAGRSSGRCAARRNRTGIAPEHGTRTPWGLELRESRRRGEGPGYPGPRRYRRRVSPPERRRSPAGRVPPRRDGMGVWSAGASTPSSKFENSEWWICSEVLPVMRCVRPSLWESERQSGWRRVAAARESLNRSAPTLEPAAPERRRPWSLAWRQFTR